VVSMVEFPEQGEIVIGRISKVLNYGAFLELLEYENLQGFVHISEVSSSWVKNIRNVVKEGQIRAGKVLHVDTGKNHVDVSLTKVSPNLQRKKIEEYKQGKRAQKLIEMLASNMKEKPENAWAEVAEPLLESYDSLFDAFNAILVNGESAAKGVQKKWIAQLIEIVEKNFEVQVKTVKGRLLISVPGPSGVETLKKALLAALKKAGKKAEILYEGSGKYVLKVSSHDFKSAEKSLKSISDGIISEIAPFGGKAEFEKVEAS